MYCSSIKGPAISDYNKRLILLSVIQLSGGDCTVFEMKFKQIIHLFGFLDKKQFIISSKPKKYFFSILERN